MTQAKIRSQLESRQCEPQPCQLLQNSRAVQLALAPRSVLVSEYINPIISPPMGESQHPALAINPIAHIPKTLLQA